MSKIAFSAFELRLRELPQQISENWVGDLKSSSTETIFKPSDRIHIVVGDERDAIPRHLHETTWALPHPKNMQSSSVLFHGLSDKKPHAARCLIPATHLTIEGKTMRAASHKWMALAGLWISGEDPIRGACFLTQTISEGGASYPAPLVVPISRFDEWLDGWTLWMDAQKCCDIVLRSRCTTD